MLSVDEARERLLRAVEPLAPIELPLLEAHGCVLAEDVVAEFNMPAFSSAVLEGFAVRSTDVHSASEEAPVSLRLVGEVPAGRRPDVTIGWGEAARIAAGAPIPAGANCVVPADRCRAEEGSVSVSQPAEEGAFIRAAGRDARAGEVLVPVGRRLSWPELGVMAGAGLAAPLAYPKVRVVVVSIGDTMAEPGHPAALGQARDAASYGVFGALRDLGAIVHRLPIVPEPDVQETVVANLARADCFVCSVGTSDGDLDPQRLHGLLPVEYSEVAMYPGAGYGFGLFQGTPFFALSGSPVSAFVAFEVLVRPAVLRMMGRRDLIRPQVRALLDEGVDRRSGITQFVPVFVEHREGTWHARPTGPADPDLMSAVVRSNGLLVVPPEASDVPAGARVRVQIFRPLER